MNPPDDIIQPLRSVGGFADLIDGLGLDRSARVLDCWSVEDGRTFEVERDSGGVTLVISGDRAATLPVPGWERSDRDGFPLPTRRVDLSERAESLAPILLDAAAATLAAEPPTTDNLRRRALLDVARDLARQALEPDDQPDF